MNFIKKNLRSIILAAVFGVLAIWVYQTYFAGSTGASLSAAPVASSAAGADLLAQLATLQNVKLDSAIFSDPVFISLSDFTVPIPPQPIGNANLFDPLPGRGAGALPLNIQSGTRK